MNTASELLRRLAPASAKAAVQQSIALAMTGQRPSAPAAAFNDLQSLPPDARRLEHLIEGISGNGPDARAPWYARAALLAEVLDPIFSVVSREFPTPTHRAFCRVIPAPNFRTQRLLLSIDGLRVHEIADGGEVKNVLADDLGINYATTAIRSYGALFSVSRRAMLNDGAMDYLGRIGEALVAAAYREEERQLYALLESNPTMSDGEPLFADGNSASGPGAVAALIDGVQKFHEQQFPTGEFVSAQPAFLILPPSWAVTISDVLAEMALQRPPIAIVKSPHVSAAYLLASPMRAPTIGLLVLNPAPALALGKPRAATDMAADLKVEHDFAPLALSRAGIVKISTNP